MSRPGTQFSLIQRQIDEVELAGKMSTNDCSQLQNQGRRVSQLLEGESVQNQGTR